MLASVSLHQLSYSTPDGQSLFSNLNLSFDRGRTGLIGRNGTGKSTLLRIISGLLVPTSGSLRTTGSLAMLSQTVQLDAHETVADHLGVTQELSRLDRLEQGAGTLEDVELADWTIPGNIETALSEVGLPVCDPGRLLSTLSGGQRTRLALARLVLKQPDIILLDEPTNNLDAAGRQAVTDLLHRWRGTAIVVSHDRRLLREMDAIVELTTLGATTYGGNWDDYAQRKTQELASTENQLISAERRVAEIDRKIQTVAEKKARKDSAGKRNAAKGGTPKIMLGGMKENAENTSGGNMKLAAKLRGEAADAATAARAKIETLVPLSVSLSPTCLPDGRTVLQVENITGGPDTSSPIIHNLSLQLVGPERIAVSGPNGSGKTTLLRLITGAMRPVTGTANILVPYAMLDQTVSLLDPSLSIRENFRQLNVGADEQTCRSALARFMFRADAALQLVGSLSGGEMLRAGLACTIGGTSPPQLLILDEPTNHLDIQSIEQVEAGLRGYDGALIVVSHDNAFLDHIGVQKTLDLNNFKQ